MIRFSKPPRLRKIWVGIDNCDGKTHPTSVNAQTKVSAKGQVVIPKDVRDRLRFAPGTALEVIESGDSVTLRHVRPPKTRTFEECIARIKARANYTGPPVSIEEMNASIDEMFHNKNDDRF